jgi:hypothetical protein
MYLKSGNEELMLIGHIFKEEKKQEFNLLFNAYNSATFYGCL